MRRPWKEFNNSAIEGGVDVVHLLFYFNQQLRYPARLTLKGYSN